MDLQHESQQLETAPMIWFCRGLDGEGVYEWWRKRVNRELESKNSDRNKPVGSCSALTLEPRGATWTRSPPDALGVFLAVLRVHHDAHPKRRSRPHRKMTMSASSTSVSARPYCSGPGLSSPWCRQWTANATAYRGYGCCVRPPAGVQEGFFPRRRRI